MLFRLVRPMKRAGSRNQYFIKRIPADLKSRDEDLRVYVPIGDEAISYVISRRAQTVRLSLRTSEPAEVKQRLAQVDAFFEKLWNALREREPVSLTHREATALAGELYKAWASCDEDERTLAIEHTPEGWKRLNSKSLQEEEWDAANEFWSKLEEDGRIEKLEKSLGPIVDRLLLAKGIRRVDEASREMLFDAFVKAMKDAMAQRKKMASGDYSGDTTLERFPEWKRGKDAVGFPLAISLGGHVESWCAEAKAALRRCTTAKGRLRSPLGTLSTGTGRIPSPPGPAHRPRVSPLDHEHTRAQGRPGTEACHGG